MQLVLLVGTVVASLGAALLSSAFVLRLLLHLMARFR